MKGLSTVAVVLVGALAGCGGDEPLRVEQVAVAGGAGGSTGLAGAAGTGAGAGSSGAGGASAAGSGTAGAGGSAGAGGASAGAGGASAGAGGANPGPTRYDHDAERSPVTAAVAKRIAAVAAKNASRKADVFMKVGASGTVSTRLLHCFAGPAKPQYTLDLAGADALLSTIQHFRAGAAAGTTPFDRVTLAAEVGKTAAWAITGSPSPLRAELDLLSPRYAFVNYGTNDMEAGATYESALFPFVENLEQLLDELESEGVVPLVTNLNPRGDDVGAARWDSTYAAVTLGLVERRQLPFVNLFVASSKLPGQGLGPDGLHGNVLTVGGKDQPCVFTAEGLQWNYDARNLRSIEALHQAHLALSGAPPTETSALPPVPGDGSAASPFVVDRLPFTHASSTATSTADSLDAYPGCAATQDESGPERHYVLDLDAPTALRVMVFDRGEVDVDLHRLDGALPPTGAACIARHDRILQGIVPAGKTRFVVDSFVSKGVAKAGDYLFVVVPCEGGDCG